VATCVPLIQVYNVNLILGQRSHKYSRDYNDEGESYCYRESNQMRGSGRVLFKIALLFPHFSQKQRFVIQDVFGNRFFDHASYWKWCFSLSSSGNLNVHRLYNFLIQKGSDFVEGLQFEM